MNFGPSNTLKVAIICAILSLPLACAGSDAHNNRSNHDVGVLISPTRATLQTGQSQQFAASVSGTSHKAVTWLVNGSAGGNSTVGTVSSSGFYVAPSKAPTTSILVTAQSAYQSSASASAAVSVVSPSPVSVSITPTSATLQTGQSQQFYATVSGTANTAVTWLVNGSAGGNSTVGTVSSSGLYVAPSKAPTTSILVTAQSAYQSSALASAAVSIVNPPPVSVSISPASATVQIGQSQQFYATVSGTTSTQVSWLVNGVAGGSQSTGTVSSGGQYTAPASVPSVAVTVTAQSTYSTVASASAQVTVSAPVAHTVALSWNPNTSPVAGYNVYRSMQSNGGYARINSVLDTATVFTDSAVQAGQTYYYVTTAVDSNGSESGYSNTVQAVIP